MLIGFGRKAGILLILTCLQVFVTHPVSAQKRGDIWYFGKNAGLDFSNHHPYPLTDGQTNTEAGVATVSDSLGNLLFYTDGVRIWNKYHQIMFSADSLLGDTLSTQAANVVYNLEIPDRYHLFTTQKAPSDNSIFYGPHHYVIDFSKNPRGEVNWDLSSQYPEDGLIPFPSEKFLAIPFYSFREVKGYWIILHQVLTNRNIFHRYWLEDTLSFHSEKEYGWNNTTGRYGQIAASPNGDRFAIAGGRWFQLFYFDKGTGEITRMIQMPAGDKENDEAYSHQAYGVAFSPTGNFLYGTARDMGIVYQWDLQYTQADALVGSINILSDNPMARYGEMQLAPNGKIYFTVYGQDYLGVINVPTRRKILDPTLKQFEEFGARLVDTETGKGGIGYFGLPNTLPHDFKAEPFYYLRTCYGDSTYLYLSDNSELIDLPYWCIFRPNGQTPIDTVFSSSTFDAYYSFPEPSTYDVVLYTNQGEEVNTYKQSITIHEVQPIGWPDTLIYCSGSELILDAGKGAFFEWDDRDLKDRYRSITEQQYLIQNYRVKRRDYNNCVAWDTIWLEKKNPPVLTYETQKAICGDMQGWIRVTPDGALDRYSFFWEEDTTNTSNELTGLRGGYYHVTVTNKSTNCSTYKEIFVDEFGGANIRIIPEQDSICPGTPTVLTVINADSVNWIEPSEPNTEQIMVAPLLTTTYRIEAYNWDEVNNECMTEVVFTLHVHPDNKPDIGPDLQACEGDTLILEGGNGYASWSWSNGLNDSIIKITQSYEQLILATTDMNQCHFSDTIQVNFNPAPVLTTVSDKALCGEGNGRAIVIPEGNIEDFHYFWEGYPNLDTNMLTDLFEGSYSVRVVSSEQCESSAEILVEKVDQPQLLISSSTEQQICAGTPVTLTVSGAEHYQWDHTMMDTSQVMVFPVSDTVFKVIGINRDNQGNQCVDSITYAIQVFPDERPNLGDDRYVCEGETIILDLGDNYSSIYWNIGSNETRLEITETVDPLIIEAIDKNGCTYKDSVSFQFISRPQLTYTAEKALCGEANGAATVMTQGDPADFDFIWEYDSTVNSPILTNIPGGVYRVHVYTREAGCESIIDIPVPELGGPDVQIYSTAEDGSCPGTEVILTATNADAYEWINPSGDTTASIQVHPWIETTYTVKGIKIDEEGHRCGTYKDITVPVFPDNTPSLRDLISGCEGDTIIIDGGDQYDEWFWNTGTASRFAYVSHPTDSLILKVTDTNGCHFRDTARVVFNPYPDLDLGQDKALCTNAPVELYGGSGDQYLWNTGEITERIAVNETGTYILHLSRSGCTSTDSIQIKILNPDLLRIDSIITYDATCPGSTDGQLEIQVSGSGDYYEYSIDNGLSWSTESWFTNLLPGSGYYIRIREDSLCEISSDGMIAIGEPDSLKIIYSIFPPSCGICRDGEIHLREISGGHPPYSVLWEDLDTSFYRNDLWEDRFTITITDSTGCIQHFSIPLEIIYTIPNAFTPNGDGINDVWRIKDIENYPDVIVRVYTPDGQLIFESPKGYPKPWDGTRKGNPVPMGSYYYIIEYVQGVEPLSGSLTIMR